MSSFTRRIQRSVLRGKKDKDGKPVGVHYEGRGRNLGVEHKQDPCRLARIEREAKRAAASAA